MTEERYQNLLRIAHLLNVFCIIEVIMILAFTYLSFDLLFWYQTIVTPETFNPIAFWGAITGIVTTIFTAVRNIHLTLEKTSKE